MLFIYNIIIFIYRLLIGIAAASSNPKAKQWIEGRKKILAKTEQEVSKFKDTAGQTVWFHCASLGEFEQGRPVMEKIKSRYPDIKIILTFFSPSGYEIRKNYQGADAVLYLPLDTKNNAEEFIRIIRPLCVFFVKYEFWYHYFMELHKQHIPLYMISAVFRPGQIFFRGYGSFFRNLLKTVSHFFIQNNVSKILLNNIGITDVTISGDTRFDRVYYTCLHAKEILLATRFKQNKKVLIAGSAWDEEEKITVKLISDFKFRFPDLKYIIAPHEIKEERIKKLMTAINGKVIRFSQATLENCADADVLLIDNIGMLSSLYRYAEFALIGGGFGHGIHNILEPAVFGMPVFFGTKYHKFQEAQDLIRLGGAFSFSVYDELKNKIEKFLWDEHLYYEVAQISKKYVEDNTGATEIIMQFVEKNFLSTQNLKSRM